MLEPSTELLTEGLARLKGSLDGLPLLGTKACAGAFPSTAAGKQAARFCRDRGYVRAVRRIAPGRQALEVFLLAPSGEAWLREQAAPRVALRHLATALAQRSEQVESLLRHAQEQRHLLASLQGWIERLLARCREDEEANTSDPLPGESDVLIALEDWHAANRLEDCPLPDLYRQIERRLPGLTVGRFHDGCRRLLERGRIYLHPWTGPLYELPEPAFAFLAGHEIAYYASLRDGSRGRETSEETLDKAAEVSRLQLRAVAEVVR